MINALLNKDGIGKTSIVPGELFPLGYQQITDLSSSTALTIPTYSRLALVVVEGQGVRWRDDSSSPTATVGMPLAAGDRMLYDANLSALRFIQQLSGAILNVSYYS